MRVASLFPFLFSLSHSAQGHCSLAYPTFMTFILQDEKGAFNFDQETVINPETGERVRRASVESGHWGRGHRQGLILGSWVILAD